MRNREQRRNSKKAEIRLRKKVAKAFDMMTPEEQANAYAAIIEATGKAQAELTRLQREKGVIVDEGISGEEGEPGNTGD